MVVWLRKMDRIEPGASRTERYIALVQVGLPLSVGVPRGVMPRISGFRRASIEG